MPSLLPTHSPLQHRSALSKVDEEAVHHGHEHVADVRQHHHLWVCQAGLQGYREKTTLVVCNWYWDS